MVNLKRYGWVVIPLLLLSIFYFTKGEVDQQVVSPEPLVVKNEVEAKEPSGEIKVDVKGEVLHPGVYEVKEGMRVDDVIRLSGGLTPEADPASVNLAQKLLDEMVVQVTSRIPGEGVGQPSSSEQLAINQATVEEIQQLNGIGPSKAAAIVQYREENGPFQTKEEMLKVAGIGERTLENLAEDIRIP